MERKVKQRSIVVLVEDNGKSPGTPNAFGSLAAGESHPAGTGSTLGPAHA